MRTHRAHRTGQTFLIALVLRIHQAQTIGLWQKRSLMGSPLDKLQQFAVHIYLGKEFSLNPVTFLQVL